MKIGIITFHDVYNYGAVLQAYALQQVIAEMGYDCEIIDYKSKYFRKLYRPINIKDIRHLKGFVKKIRMIPANLKMGNSMKNFKETFLKLSQSYKKNDIKNCNNDYDMFITGSDQVWNLKINGNDTTYFLDFVEDKNKCISYAASIARDSLSVQEADIFKEQLMYFKDISIREEDSKQLIKKYINRDISVDLDPTLLLERERWTNITVQKDSLDYILVYVMTAQDDVIEYAKKLGREKNLPIKYISLYDPQIEGINMIFAPEVVEWLNLFRNAKYIITNSFHGIAFSIIFHKQFVYNLTHNNGKNVRINSLMNQLKIENREMKVNEIDDIEQEIDYVMVDRLIENKRKNSTNYLVRNIGREN